MSTPATPDRTAEPTPDRRPVAPDRRLELAVVWAARIVWLAIALLAGPAFGAALATHDRAVRLIGTIGLWAGWGGVALALMVPSAIGLTATRSLVPAGLVAAVVAAFGADDALQATGAIAPLAVMCLVAATGEFGHHFVQGSAYGDEQRHLLRPPVAFLVPTVVSWAVWCAATIAGPLSLAAGNWLVGVPVTLVTLGLSWLLPRRLHRLSRRWLVLVPAGVVVHDHVVLAETAMFLRTAVARMGLAYADTEAADLTGPAAGHAVEIELREMATVVLAPTRAKPGGTALHVKSMLIAPTRPGQLLSAAGARRITVG